MLTVGFDLDMTLIDPRPGMVLAMDELGRECGFPLDGEKFAANLGPPLDRVLLDFGVPAERVPGMVDRFRETYPEIVIPATVALPGAAAALAAVREAGGRTVVITGKYGPNAEKHLAALGWQVDHVIGAVWGGGKTQALVRHKAKLYIGDHQADMISAQQIPGVYPVGVCTGPCSEAELNEAGAKTVLPDLRAFPAWFSTWRET